MFILRFFSFKISLKIIWNCPDSLIYHTTDVYSPQTPYGELFSNNLAPIFFYHIHLFSSVCTYVSLSEPILIGQNLFLSVRTYFHLCALVFICENLFLSMIIFDDLFLLMIICENFIFLWSSLRIFQNIFLLLQPLWK